jgi:hypothetical protein
MDKINRFSCTIFPDEDVVIYSYVSRFSIDGEPDEALAYNWRLGRWTPGKMRVGILGRSASLPIFTDDPVLPLPGFVPGVSVTDDYAQATDSFTFRRNDYIAAIVDGALAALSYPTNQTIQLETEELEISPGYMGKLVRFRPIVDNIGNVLGKVKTRNAQTTDTIYRVRSGLRREVDGSYKCGEKGRYHTIGLDIITPMRKAIGVDIIDFAKLGKR